MVTPIDFSKSLPQQILSTLPSYHHPARLSLFSLPLPRTLIISSNVPITMPFCPFCGSCCETMPGLSKHLSQSASCAAALSKDPLNAKLLVSSSKSSTSLFAPGDKHNRDIDFLGDDGDTPLLPATKLPRKAT